MHLTVMGTLLLHCTCIRGQVGDRAHVHSSAYKTVERRGMPKSKGSQVHALRMHSGCCLLRMQVFLHASTCAYLYIYTYMCVFVFFCMNSRKF